MLGRPFHQGHPAWLAMLLLTLAGCAPRAEPASLLEPVYCYRRLADVTCHTAPDPGREGTFRGVYLRDPLDPGWPDRWLPRAGP